MIESNRSVTTSIMALGLLGYSSMSIADVGDVSGGLKLGQTLISDLLDIPGVSQDDGLAFGVNIGYTFAPNLTAEFEYVTGGTEFSGNAGSIDADVDSTSIYAAYRSSGPLYFVGRIGVTSVKVSIDGFGSESDSGLSYGLGGGYRLMPNLTLEADYTMVDQDTDWLMLSVRYDVQ